MTTSTDPIANYAAQTQAAQAAAAAAKKGSSGSLGINEFLKLMTAQMKNQDPMKPLEGTEFVSQLATFGTVSGVNEMKTSLETLSASLRSTQTLNGTTMVGRDILASADSFEHAQGGTLTGQVDVPAGAATVQVRITDSTGSVVREMTLPNSVGTQTFTWDGLDSTGHAAASDTYNIETIATNGGQSGSLETLIAGRVSSVSIDATGTNLTLNTAGLGAVAMTDVRRVM